MFRAFCESYIHSTGPGPGPGSIIRVCTNTHTYVRTYIYIQDMRTKVKECAVTSECANSNVMPTLRGFRWYLYFVAQE